MQNLSYIYSNGKLMKYVNIEIIHARKYASLTKKKVSLFVSIKDALHARFQ